MTTTKIILITALCALTGLSAVQAENTVQAVTAATQTAAPRLEHPFFQDEPYPVWSQMTPEQGVADVRAAIKLAQARIDAICALTPEQTTFENTFLALDAAGLELSQANGYLHHLANVLSNPEIRQAQETLIPELSEYSAGIIANEQLWKVLKAAAAQPWVKELSPAKQRFVQQTVDSFKDSGADLPADKKARKAEIQEELSQLTLQFSKNVQESTDAWELVITDPAELDGVSSQWMGIARAAAESKGYSTPDKPAWLITQQYSSLSPVMCDCTVEATRRKCWEGQCSIGKGGEWDNEAIVARIMELRSELATLLGFPTYAEMTTHRRMVGGGEQALAFIDDMMSKVKPAFDEECKQLLEFISEQKGEKVEKLQPWDRSFYVRRLTKKLYDFDSEAMRPYQKEENVIKGMFDIYGHLFDISFSEVETACLKPGVPCPAGTVEVWHPQVRFFRVTDNKTGNHLGSFYLDPFPREGKRDGAWVMPMRFGKAGVNGQPHEPHLATLVGNFTAPMANGVTLYSHYDVQTIFHEFGHMLHNMLSDTELQAHAGTSVTWDFVELPSQLFENWTWSAEGNAKYAFHWQTGKPVPADLIEKLGKSRYFMPASSTMSQLCLGKLDLEMHMHYDEKFRGKSLDAATDEMLEGCRVPSTVYAPSIMRSLTHCISGGYAAGYYSYKWAEVLSADVFMRFEQDGIMNAGTGAAFRETILSKGDSKPAAEIYRDFMGRDPNPDALLQSQGLLKK